MSLCVKAALIFCVLFPMTMGPSFGQTTAQRQNHGFRWGNVQWDGRTIRAVGDITLPVGVTLPSWLSPVGDRALVLVPPPAWGKALRGAVYFWFPQEQEQRIIDWLNSFPNDFVLPKGSFDLICPSVEGHVVDATDQSNWPRVFRHAKTAKNWTYWAILNVPAGSPWHIVHLRAAIVCLASLNDPGLSGMSSGFPAAVSATDSPIRKEKSLILVSLSFLR